MSNPVSFLFKTTYQFYNIFCPFNPLVNIAAAVPAVYVGWHTNRDGVRAVDDFLSNNCERLASAAYGFFNPEADVSSSTASSALCIGASYLLTPGSTTLAWIAATATFYATGIVLNTALKITLFVGECLFIPVSDDDYPDEEELPAIENGSVNKPQQLAIADQPDVSKKRDVAQLDRLKDFELCNDCKEKALVKLRVRRG